MTVNAQQEKLRQIQILCSELVCSNINTILGKKHKSPYNSSINLNGIKENEDQLRSQSMLSKLQRGECNDFWKEIKALDPKKECLPLTVGGTSGESNISNLWKDHFSAIANSVGSTDNRDQGPDLQRYIRIRISSSYYFTTTGALGSKFIYTIYFVKEFVVGS